MLVVQISAQTAWGYLKYLGLFKMLYLAIMDVMKNGLVAGVIGYEPHSQLEFFFADRIRY